MDTYLGERGRAFERDKGFGEGENNVCRVGQEVAYNEEREVSHQLPSKRTGNSLIIQHAVLVKQSDSGITLAANKVSAH